MTVLVVCSSLFRIAQYAVRLCRLFKFCFCFFIPWVHIRMILFASFRYAFSRSHHQLRALHPEPHNNLFSLPFSFTLSKRLVPLGDTTAELSTHMMSGSKVQKSSCKQAYIRFPILKPWHHHIMGTVTLPVSPSPAFTYTTCITIW